MCDVFVLLDNVPYSRNDFQNRNKIRTGGTSTGWCWLTVPVLTKGRFGQKLNEVEINAADKTWSRGCWKSINYSYGRARHFEKYEGFVNELYNKTSWDSLLALNIHIIKFLKQAFEIDRQIKLASEICETGSGSELLLRICQKLGADEYISGRVGKDYLDEALFDQQGIEVTYQSFRHPEYPQAYKPFIPNLSAIDLLFNCGDEARGIFSPT